MTRKLRLTAAQQKVTAATNALDGSALGKAQQELTQAQTAAKQAQAKLTAAQKALADAQTLSNKRIML